jgi:hypothetical protein
VNYFSDEEDFRKKIMGLINQHYDEIKQEECKKKQKFHEAIEKVTGKSIQERRRSKMVKDNLLLVVNFSHRHI